MQNEQAQAQASIGTLALFLLLAPITLQAVTVVLSVVELRMKRRPWWWYR
jgi:hypothetical protein